MTAAAKPLRKDAALNREKVLAAAAEVFHEQGLAAGMEDVARRAGVGVGTVYRRFPDRAALLDALLTELLEEYRVLTEQALGREDGLADFLRAMGEVQATPRGCVLRLWSPPTSAGPHEQLREGMRALLLDAQARGTCRADTTLDDVIAIMVALRGVREATVPADWRRHLELCLRGLRP